MHDEATEPSFEIGGHPLHQAYVLGGFPVDPSESERLREFLDDQFDPQELDNEDEDSSSPEESVWGQTLGETTRWQVPDPAAFAIRQRDPTNDRKRHQLENIVADVRYGFRTSSEVPFEIFVCQLDLRISELDQEDRLGILLQRLTDTVRGLVYTPLYETDTLTGEPRPFGIFYGRVEGGRDELKDLWELCGDIEELPDDGNAAQAKLRCQLRDAVGFGHPRDDRRELSHIPAALNVSYQLGQLAPGGLSGHPPAYVLELRTDIPEEPPHDASPSGSIPSFAHSTALADWTGSIAYLHALDLWLHRIEERRSHTVEELDAAVQGSREGLWGAIQILPEIKAISNELLLVRSRFDKVDVRDRRGIAGHIDGSGGPREIGLPPPWWETSREWDGRDTRYLSNLCESVLDRYEAQLEAVRRVEGRASTLRSQVHTTVSSRLTIWIAVLTFVLVVTELWAPIEAISTWLAGQGTDAVDSLAQLASP